VKGSEEKGCQIEVRGKKKISEGIWETESRTEKCGLGLGSVNRCIQKKAVDGFFYLWNSSMPCCL
jgi:hypothetical protein